MTQTLASLGLTTASLASLILAGTVAAQSPSPAPQAKRMQWSFAEGVKRLGLLFSDIGSLASGPAAGEVWQVDKRTGQRRRIGAASDLSWPTPSPDGSAVYALRGRQVLRIVIPGGQEAPVGAPANCSKLLGVLPEGVIGIIDDDPFPRPALLSQDGKRADLPPPADDEQRRQIGVLLQEARSYGDGVRLAAVLTSKSSTAALFWNAIAATAAAVKNGQSRYDGFSPLAPHVRSLAAPFSISRVPFVLCACVASGEKNNGNLSSPGAR